MIIGVHMTTDKQFIVEFIKNLSVKNYNDAEKALQMAVNEKVKARIKNSMKAMKAKKQ